jgi:hypothetical protein
MDDDNLTDLFDDLLDDVGDIDKDAPDISDFTDTTD